MKISSFTLLLFSLFFLPYAGFSQVESVTTLALENRIVESKAQVGDRFFFETDRPSQIWVSDGTDAGTQVIAETSVQFFEVIGDELYYAVPGALYKINGTTLEITFLTAFEGVVLEHFFFQGNMILLTQAFTVGTSYHLLNYSIDTNSLESLVSSVVEIKGFIQLDEAFLFSTGNDIWACDGTVNGVELLFEGTLGIVSGINLEEGTTFNGIGYFSLGIDSIGEEPWRTDGTAAGTFMLADLYEGTWQNGAGKSSIPRGFYEKDGWLYFLGFTDAGYQLYRSDGTEAGTQPVVPFRDAFGIYNVKEFIRFKNTFYFQCIAPEYGVEWWTSDGTIAGTRIIRDIWEGAGGMRTQLAALRTYMGNEYLYFNAVNNFHGMELWRTDGTETGTQMVQDLTPGADGSFIEPLINLGTDFYFIEGSKDTEFVLRKYDENMALSEPQSNPTEYDWFQSMGSNYDLGTNTYYTYNDALVVDSEDNIYLSGDFRSRYFSFFESADYVEKDYTADGLSTNFLAAIDKNGQHKWSKHIGGESFSKDQMITIDNTNQLVVAGTINERGVFDETIIDRNTGGGMYLTKLDQEGNYLWIKQASIGTFSKSDVNQIVTDSENNIYVAGCFGGFSARFGNWSLSAPISPAFFVAKYDKDGNELWAKTLDYPSVDIHGEVKALMVDSKDRVYTVISAGGYNWSSSCEYSDWTIQMRAFETNGEERWQKEWISSDLTFVTKASMSPADEVFLCGMYRGDFQMGSQSFNVPCERIEGFLTKLDLNGQPINTITFPEETYLYDLAFGEQGTYYLSGREVLENAAPGAFNYFRNLRNQVFVKKYDKYDRLLEQRRFSKTHFQWWDSNPIIAVDDDNKVILNGVYNFQMDTIPNCSRDFNNHIYLMKFALSTSPNYEEDAEVSQEDVLLFPNPVTDHLRVYSEDEDVQNVRFIIFDASGKQVSVLGSRFNYGYTLLDVSPLSPGIYFLKIETDSNSIVEKFVKQ